MKSLIYTTFCPVDEEPDTKPVVPITPPESDKRNGK